MKLLFLCAATAFAVAPPRIELNLASTQSYGVATINRLANSEVERALVQTALIRPDTAQITQPDGTGVMSRRDWTQTCPAGKDTTATNCPRPTARAWDHNDQEVEVNEHIYLVDLDNKQALGGVQLPKAVTSVDFTYRATYLFKYDAQDAAGNHAEQVVFMLVLNDPTVPVITPCGNSPDFIEAATSQVLCSTSTAKDNMDKTDFDERRTTRSIRYSIFKCKNTGDYSDPTTGYPAAATKSMGADANNHDMGRGCATRDAQLVHQAEYGIAKTELDSKFVGTYEVVISAHDNAGKYGSGGANNVNAYHKIVIVRDLTLPVIVAHLDDSNDTSQTHECATPYKDIGASVTDSLDTAALGGVVALRTTGLPDIATRATYTVKYDATDVAQNHAVRKTRTVEVIDTTDPEITLASDPAHANPYQLDMQHPVHSDNQGAYNGFTDPGATVKDTCDVGIAARYGNFKGTWDRTPVCGGGSDGLQCLGDYTLTYTAKDQSGNTDTETRTVTFIDAQQPELSLKGARNEVSVQEASPSELYSEDSAECHDYVGGDITNAVVVTVGSYNGKPTGHVDFSTVGTYVVDYNCRDASNNDAMTIHRTIHVVDTTIPEIQLKCAECDRCAAGLKQNAKGEYSFKKAACRCPVEHLEAGFKYVEQGACAVDNLDGSRDAQIQIAGTVDPRHHHKLTTYAAGTYTITYDVKDSQGTKVTGNWAAGSGKVVVNRNAAVRVKRTIIVKDTLPPVISLHMRIGNSLSKAFHVSKSDQTGLHGVANPAAQFAQTEGAVDGGNKHLRGGRPVHKDYNLAKFAIGKMPESIDERTDLQEFTSPYV